MPNANDGDTSHDAPDNKGDDKPDYIKASEFDAKLNAAISGHTKRLAKSLEDSVAKRLAEFAASLPKPPEGGEGGSGTGGDGAGAKPPGKSPEVASLERRLAEFEKQLAAERAARTEIEAKSRTEKARALVSDALGAHIRPETAGVVRSYLFAEHVQFDDDGTPLFVDGDTRLPLADGVAGWLKSKAADPYKPAPSSGGTGASGGRGGAPPAARGPNGVPKYDREATTPEEKARRAYELEQALRARGVDL